MHQLVTGGFETTTSALNHGMWLITRRPDVQERVRKDLSLVPSFVEEVLRFESPVAGLVRRATQDVEVNGVVIPEGAMVMARYQAANRDAEVFDHADEFDLDRSRDHQHLAFGVGRTSVSVPRLRARNWCRHSPPGSNARRTLSSPSHSTVRSMNPVSCFTRWSSCHSGSRLLEHEPPSDGVLDHQ